MQVRLLLALLALLAAAAPAAAQKRIALTFDDVPRNAGAFLTPDQRTKMLIRDLRKAGVLQAAFFVNPSQLGDPERGHGAAHIRAYVAAGHVIADHSFTHPHLTALTVDAYLADIDKAEQWLKSQPGRRPWFRFPFLDEGGRDKAKRDALRAGLAARGLHNGYVTSDSNDWLMEALAIDAKRAGQPMLRGTRKHHALPSSPAGW